MAWKCKECGGEIHAIVTLSISKTFTLSKNGGLKKCLTRKPSEETTGINYFCDKCNNYWENGTQLEDIAEWVKD